MKLYAALLCILPAAWGQDGPAWDNSGNSRLKGTYNYRHVVWFAADEAGNLSRSVSFTGSIDFDGEGGYALRARVMDSNAGAEQTFNTSGFYRIAASGFGFLKSPVTGEGSVFGLVSGGIFIGSSTDNRLNDLFIAAPAGATAVQGRYRVAEMNFPSLRMVQARDALYDLNFGGQGSTGTVNAIGYIGGNARRVTQTVTGASYTFTDGAGTVSFGGTLNDSNLLAGTRTLFVSPDGNFIFGGATNGWNMFIGVRPGAGEQLQGLYYQAGVDADLGELSNGRAIMHTYYGAFSAKDGTQINHQRLLDGVDELPVDFTYSDIYEVNAQGVYEDFLGFQNIIGAGGAIRIAFGQETTPGIGIALKAPDLMGEGVFLHPAGIRNAASAAPFTVGIVPGEMITLAGSGFPESADGVEVLINRRAAQVREVTPERITAIVPFETTGPVAEVRVKTPAGESMPVTMFVSTTAPGVFTEPAGGFGLARAFHPDGSPVNADNPARPGARIQVQAAGLGLVDPAIADGQAAPENPRSRALAGIGAFLDGKRATVDFAGLAPGLIGVYLVEFVVPSNVRNGSRYLDISGPDSYHTQAEIPIAGSTVSGNVRAAGTPGRLEKTRPHFPHDAARRAGTRLTPAAKPATLRKELLP
jgi:uncharacterized protein (TIGR03437 family)